MTGSNMTPDTTGALLQASQNQTHNLSSKLGGGNKSIEEIGKAAEEFEAVFISAMMKPMFEGTELPSPFGGGKGEEIFKDMMLDEYGKLMSKTGAIGLASEVKSTLIDLQGLQNSGKPKFQEVNASPMDKAAEQLNNIIVGE